MREFSRYTQNNSPFLYDTFAVVLRVFVKGSPPFLGEGFEMFNTFVIDELLI